MSDRTVHAVTGNGSSVVRYDRAGAWWLEGDGRRTRLRVAEAVSIATDPTSVWREGLPGGTYFDAQVRKARRS